jgi:hypothetical protein
MISPKEYEVFKVFKRGEFSIVTFCNYNHDPKALSSCCHDKLILSNFLFSVVFLVVRRVSYETSFDSKQPKLEPKLASKLSKIRRLFRLFRLNIETKRKQPKQTGKRAKNLMNFN